MASRRWRANATSAVAVFPATWAPWLVSQGIRRARSDHLVRLVILSLVGGLLGALLLLVSSNAFSSR